MSKFNFKMNRQSGRGQGCLILFGMPFFGAGAAILWFMVISPILQVSQSDNWVKDVPVLSIPKIPQKQFWLKTGEEVFLNG